MDTLEIMEYFTAENRKHWLEEIGRCEWGAGKYLHSLLSENSLKKAVGETALVLMLAEGERLVSFCTFAPLDDIQPTELSPWIGFVYTFPEYRGHRYAGILLEYAESLACVMGKESIYISPGHTGLYEKYGYEFFKTEKDVSYCGLSCDHCFLGEWCGGCRSVFSCCSFGTLQEKGKCPNIVCCEEKGIDGCYECEELDDCAKGFYQNGSDGRVAKAQAFFIRKYGKEKLLHAHDKLNEVYGFKKAQELLGTDVKTGLKILEEKNHAEN